MHPQISAYTAGSLTYSVNGGSFKTVTGTNNTWLDLTADLGGGTFSSIALKYVSDALKLLFWFSQVRLNGQVLIDNAPITTLTFSSDKDLAEFSYGDAVNQNDSAASGTVGSVDVGANTMTLATSTGTWGPANTGKTVVGPTTTAGSGTVASTDVGTNTMTLSTSTGTWTPNADKTVVGPTKPASNVKLYTVHDSAGAVSDLQSADPGYVTMAGNSPYTLTFPATFPTGNAPDTDLPAGTSITTEIQATNTAGTDVETSNTVTPS